LKLLDRYVLKELAVPFIIGTVAVVLMFQANMLIAQFRELQFRDIPLVAMVQMVIFKTPEFLVLTLPVGVTLAASLALSRLARESELTAVRAAGTPIFRVLLPVMAFGLAVGVGNYFIVERVMPTSEREFIRVMRDSALVAGAPDFRSNVVFQIGTFTAWIGTVARSPDGAINLSQVMMFEMQRADEQWVYQAASGYYRDDELVLREPIVWVFKGPTVISASSAAEDLTFREKITIDQFFMPPEPQEQTTEELRQTIIQQREMGNDTTVQEIAYHIRFSVPAACVVFALTGPIFAIWLANRGAFVGVLLSILTVFLYYNIFIISTQVLGPSRIVDPVLAAWLPNIIFVVLGLLALRKLE
jgi:lipopolysaccharide export system permease protein